LSPRAACRLDALGFAEVYDYVPGKADWLAHNLPSEGEHADLPTAGRFLRVDVATCALDDRVGEVRARIEDSPYGFALVTSVGQVLLGRARRSALNGDPGEPVEAVMEPGPSTVRADTPATELAKRLAEGDLKTAVVTTPEGRLLGIVLRRDLEAAATD
jgi:CBS domain-containing protein